MRVEGIKEGLNCEVRNYICFCRWLFIRVVHIRIDVG